MQNKKKWNGFVLSMLNHFFGIDAEDIFLKIMIDRYGYVHDISKMNKEVDISITSNFVDIFQSSPYVKVDQKNFFELLFLQSVNGSSYVFSHNEIEIDKICAISVEEKTEFAMRVFIDVHHHNGAVFFRGARVIIFVNDLNLQKIKRKTIVKLKELSESDQSAEVFLLVAYALGFNKQLLDKKDVKIVS